MCMKEAYPRIGVSVSWILRPRLGQETREPREPRLGETIAGFPKAAM